MTNSLLTPPPDNVIPLDQDGARRDKPGAAGSHHRPAHVIDRRSVVAINAALATSRPLLVRGEPGVGKSQLAHAAAIGLGRRFLAHTVDAGTEPRDLLYTVDVVARLAAAQLLGALRKRPVHQHAHDELRAPLEPLDRAEVAIGNFIWPGKLWKAFDAPSAAKQEQRARAAAVQLESAGELVSADGEAPEDRGCVLLIDEIDKADSAVPNALLDALGHRKFEVPGYGTVEMRGDVRPLVIITTNEERALPDAFLRRCFVLRLGLPEDEAQVQELLLARGRAHFDGGDPAVLAILMRAASLIASRRMALRREHVPSPGVAEYIDLIDAVLGQRGDGVDPIALLDEIGEFVLHKHLSTVGEGE
jgi:MoxR-like ATPase